jgi:CubicO group peptidase (beta-lactamase class C family)
MLQAMTAQACGALGLTLAAALLGADPIEETDLRQRVSALVEATRAEAGIPALAVAVTRAGEPTLEIVSGLADRDAGLPATPGTVFPAASVSKLLTAALVMQQVEAGRLDLDAPANGYVEAPLRIRDRDGAETPATVRQLLSHTSGLPVAWGGIHFDPGEPPVSIEAHLTDRLRVIHPPGERIVYANDALALAGLLAARAAGSDFATLARRGLLDPLGMGSSSFAPGQELRGRLAAAYGSRPGDVERTDHADVGAIAPAGGLVTTASDLARFARLMVEGGVFDGVRLLQVASVTEMLRLQARTHPGLDEGFGLGFAVRRGPGRRVAWWDGSLPGAASRLLLAPDHGLGVVVLSNQAGNGPVNELAHRIVEEVLGEEPGPEPPAVGPNAARVAGVYRPFDMLDPEMPFLDLLFNVEVVEGPGGLEMRIPMIDETASMHVAGPQLFHLEGGFLDGGTVLFDGDRLYSLMMVAERVAPWETATAYLVYAGVVTLGVLAVPALLIWRRLRRRSRAAA